jgi:SlyX protein
MDDKRLIDIEMKIAYQERMIAELNSVVCDQQNTIDELKKTVRLLTERVGELSESMTLTTFGDEKPPHY